MDKLIIAEDMDWNDTRKKITFVSKKKKKLMYHQQ